MIINDQERGKKVSYIMRHLFVKIGIFFINCLANATFKTAKSRTGVSQVKSSQVYFTIRLKVRRQETAKRPCGHLGQTAPFSNT